MTNGEHVLVANSTPSWQHKMCRSIMLKIFSSLPRGQMVIKENGVLVDTFGNKDDELHAEINIHCPSVYKR